MPRARKSLFSLWRHLPSRVVRIIRSKQVTVKDKLLFVVPVVLYWMLPDFFTFIPIDDVAVTVLLARWFTHAMERKYRFKE